MRWGMLARAEDRGLGNMTWEIARNLGPDRTLVVDMGDLARGFPMHLDRYPGATVAPWRDGAFEEQLVRDWLAGLDVLYSAETFYDWRIVEWARDAGCATVLHSMPEFNLHHGDHGPHRPTRFWNPTRWRQEQMPAGTVVVPVPVALDRFANREPRTDGPMRVLHTAGHRAAHDRNGTTTVLMAARRLRRPVTITLAGQDGRLPGTSTPKNVDLRIAPHNLPDYWSVYDGHDLLVIPRRYGGLCLPVQEAMAAGLAVTMTDCPPNRDWPIIPLPAAPHGTIRTGAGDIEMHAVAASTLATELDVLAANPEIVAAWQVLSRAWAEAHSWDELRETWLAELALACVAARR